MDFVDAVLIAQGGTAARQAGQSLGLSQDQTEAALSALAPALAAGLQGNASQPGGLETLRGALAGGGHARYVDDLSALEGHDVASNDDVLGQAGKLFGGR